MDALSERVGEAHRQKGTRSLLVIDDDPAFCRLVSCILQGSFLVTDVNRIQEGWVRFLHSDLDAILLDFKMGGNLNGIELLQIVRKKVPGVPVFFTTGVGDFEIARSALKMGAVEYLPKPLSPSDLRSALSRHMSIGLSKPGLDFVVNNLDENSNSPSNQIWAKTETGIPISGDLQCFSWRSVFAILPFTAGEFQKGDPLSGIHVRLGGRLIEVDNGAIAKVVEHPRGIAVEIAMPGEWRTLSLPQESLELQNSGFSESAGNEDENEGSLSPDLKSAVRNLVNLLQEIHDELEPRQAYLLKGGAHENLLEEEAFLEHVRSQIFPAFSNAVQAFEFASVAAMDEGVETAFKQFSHRLLYPVLLCSPFISRVVERPIGVPGDFDMLGKILGDPFEGRSLLSRLINGWILTTAAADAYRFRVDFLSREIATLEPGKNEAACVLSLGSGVAYEIQKLLRGEGLAYPVNFTLVDFNEATLQEARSTLCEMREFHEASSFCFEFVQNSVKDLLNKSAPNREGEVHLAYCAGLFDYLSDRVCILVIRYLYNQLVPGGRMVVSNFTPFNPIKHFMGLVLDWKLIHRSVEDLKQLIVDADLGESAQFTMTTDPGRVEVYGSIKKLRVL